MRLITDLDWNFVVDVCGCQMGILMDGAKCRFYALTRGSHLRDLRLAAEKDRCHALAAFEVDRIREDGSRFLSDAYL